MSWNRPELSRRVATGVIGGGALFALILFGGWLGNLLFVLGLSLRMAYEFSEITLTMADRVEKRNFLFLLIWMDHWIYSVARQAEFSLLIFSFLALFVYFIITASRYTEERFLMHIREMAHLVFGLIYIGFIPLYFRKIYDASQGIKWTLLFLALVFAGDTGAYFAGLKWGKHKLYPSISPKKTREGALGGVLAGLGVALCAKVTFFPLLSWGAVLWIPLVVGPVAQIGDLCESFLKRSFDRKDSGSILPGHGGFLDRFDGVIFSLPVMHVCLQVFG